MIGSLFTTTWNHVLQSGIGFVESIHDELLRLQRCTPSPALAFDLVVTARAAVQLQAAAGPDAAIQDGVAFILDEPGQRGAGAGLGVGDDAGRRRGAFFG